MLGTSRSAPEASGTNAPVMGLIRLRCSLRQASTVM